MTVMMMKTVKTEIEIYSVTVALPLAILIHHSLGNFCSVNTVQAGSPRSMLIQGIMLIRHLRGGGSTD